MQKISRAHGDGMFSPLTPLNVRFAFQNVRHCFLPAVMMDPGLRSGLDQKSSAPQRRVDAQVSGNSREPQRTRRLRGSCAELIGMDDADGERAAFAHAQFDVPKLEKLQSNSVFSVLQL